MYDAIARALLTVIVCFAIVFAGEVVHVALTPARPFLGTLASYVLPGLPTGWCMVRLIERVYGLAPARGRRAA